MQLRLLHVLCSNEEAAASVRECIQDSDAVVEKWEQENTDSYSLFFMVNEQDQELFDALQERAEEKDTIRLTIMPIEASFPKSHEDDKKEDEKNKVSFFDIISREEMNEAVTQQSRFNGSYFTLIILSAIVATIALVEGNIAILIGAMVLTPLLGPNLALAFSTATADSKLLKRALSSGLGGLAITFLVALVVGTLIGLPADRTMTSMLVEYGFESIPIAACAGVAATILLLQGTLSSLIGVMVAVAFLPPTAMTGLAISTGDYFQAMEAAMLLAINISAFNLAAQAVLLLAGTRPHRKDENSHFKRSMALYLSGWALAIALLSVGLYFKG